VGNTGSSVVGYMPLQRQVGFIYDSPNLFIIAHELGHGAFNLRHTFSPENFIAAERTTQNLMDYNGGTELWAHQWEFIRDPQNIWFAWAQDEGEGEMKSGDDLITEVLGKIRCAKASNRTKVFIGSNGRYVFGKNRNPEVYIELYLDDNKKRYDYYELNLTYTKIDFNASKYKYVFGNDLYIIVGKDKSNLF